VGTEYVPLLQSFTVEDMGSCSPECVSRVFFVVPDFLGQLGSVLTRRVVISLVSSLGRVTHPAKFLLSCGLVSLYSIYP
jgi:hypothetical protein